MEMMIYSGNVGKLGREQLVWILKAVYGVSRQPRGNNRQKTGNRRVDFRNEARAGDTNLVVLGGLTLKSRGCQ